MNEPNPNNTARLATLDELRETTLTAFFANPPSNETLRGWFNQARIPRFKANPIAKRGGGSVYYSVAHVEKWLRARMLPKAA